MSAALALAPAPGPDGTVERLLDAAERLVADQGVDAVSVRAVNAAAGTNVAAVHYHFGSKEALLEAVLRRRMDRLGERRLGLLAALADDPAPPVRAVLETLVRPLAELGADATGPGRTYVRFLAALNAWGPAGRTLTAEVFAPQLGPFDAALARALPDLPEAVRHFRLRLVGDAVVDTLADPAAAASALIGTGTAAEYTRVVDALVDTMTGALAAPVSGTPEGAPK